MGDSAGWVAIVMVVLMVAAVYIVEEQKKPSNYSDAEIKDSIEWGKKLGRIQLHGALLFCLLALVFVTYIESLYVSRALPTPSMAIGALFGVMVLDGVRFFVPRALVGVKSPYPERARLSRFVVLFCILTSMAITAAFAWRYVYPDDGYYIDSAPGHRSVRVIDQEIERKLRRISSDIWFQSEACTDDIWRECMPIIILREERKKSEAAQNQGMRKSATWPWSLEGAIRAVLFTLLTWLAILISTLMPVLIQQAWARAGEGTKPAPAGGGEGK